MALYGDHMTIRRNVGRPPKQPTGERVALTLKIPAPIKKKLIDDSNAFGMTLTEYIITLIQRG